MFISSEFETSADVRVRVREAVIRVRVRETAVRTIISVTTNVQQLHRLHLSDLVTGLRVLAVLPVRSTRRTGHALQFSFFSAFGKEEAFSGFNLYFKMLNNLFNYH